MLFISLTFGAKSCPVFADSIMEPFLCHLHTYVSVSGPHLGYLYSSNSLFNSGLWFLKKLKGTQCIHQLTFTDDPDFQNTFLYKLCKVGIVSYNGWIKWDRHELLVLLAWITYCGMYFLPIILSYYKHLLLLGKTQVPHRLEMVSK